MYNFPSVQSQRAGGILTSAIDQQHGHRSILYFICIFVGTNFEWKINL